MEEKSRIKFAIFIALILVVSVGYSFTFALFGETPSVSLATGSGATGEEEDNAQTSNHAALQVEVVPQTVQSVIETLTRYRSYSRTIQIEYLNSGVVEGILFATVFVDNGWTRVQLTSPSGVEHTIVGDGTCYRWYDKDSNYVQFAAGEASDDLAQRLPTYEDVLALEVENITAAGYESRGGISCIYVETAMNELGYRARFWISLESGLLVSAETLKEEDVVYRMTSYQVESPLTNMDAIFALPDGTVLH